MVLKQLFISKPPIEFIEKIISGFGLNNLNDKTEFSYLDMDKHNTLNVFCNLENDLRSFYINFKKNIYFYNINYLNYKYAISFLL